MPRREQYTAWNNWEKLEPVEIDQEVYEYIAPRAERSGRTVAAQLVYELQVNRGLAPPDPGDDEARERGRLFKRIFSKRPLLG
jgi:negative regulator of replication initiation